MALPLRLEFGVRDLSLPFDVPVSVRVLRLEASLDVRGSGGVFAFATPVAVVDRRTDPARWRPVIDPGLATALAGVVVATFVALRRRLKGGHGRAANTRSGG